MTGSKFAERKNFILNVVKKLFLIVNGQKNNFLKFTNFYHKSKKLIVIHQSINIKPKT